MARADVICHAHSGTNFRRGSQFCPPVKVSDSALYTFFTDNDGNDFFYSKSTDGGFTWGEPVVIRTGAVDGVAVWYDKWTPSDTGTKVHLAYIDNGVDDVFYRSLDTSGDSLGTEATIFAGATAVSGVNTCIALTKARGGNLYCAFDIDGGTETGFYRSVDAGANWTSRTDVNEATADYYLLAPGFAADNQDIICIYWDRSADEISRKLYDDSANSWGESSIATSMADVASSLACPQFALTVSSAASKIYLAAWSNVDTLNADLRFWTIDESAITEGTNIVQNSTDDQGCVALSLATDTTTIYAFYGGKSDGSETIDNTAGINIYYKTSTDAGSTWGSETQLTLLRRDYRWLFAPILITSWFTAIYGNETAIAAGTPDYFYCSALIPSSGGGGPIFGGMVVR